MESYGELRVVMVTDDDGEPEIVNIVHTKPVEWFPEEEEEEEEEQIGRHKAGRHHADRRNAGRQKSGRRNAVRQEKDRTPRSEIYTYVSAINGDDDIRDLARPTESIFEYAHRAYRQLRAQDLSRMGMLRHWRSPRYRLRV